MFTFKRPPVFALFAISLSFCGDGFAQPGNPFDRVADSSAWKMELLIRRDGRKFLGYLQDRSKQEIKFVEIKREKNKQLYLVTHHYHPRSVANIISLSEPDRAELLKRIEPLLSKKSHARIEAGRMEDIVLVEKKAADQQSYVYEGDWFQLESRADEETTRRCVVRVEQVFRAYNQVLPPLVRRGDKLSILLHGSMDAYRDDLHRRQLRIANPAFFSTQQNLIVAGSELTSYGKQVARIRETNQKRREEYDRMDEQFRRRLDELRGELQSGGYSSDEIRLRLRLLNAKWKADNKVDGQYWQMMRKLSAVDRRNEAMFDEVTNQMFRRLFHEAFHAYLENYVFPQRSFNVPRWLDEGLAQIFENSRLDGNTLRIDAPDRTMLQLLKEDLSNKRPLSIAKLLRTQDAAFLVTHDSSVAAERHYLYSWGLAYFLVFEKNILSGDQLAKYVALAEANKAPVARFKQLTGISLDQLQREWREYVLDMKLGPR